MEKEKVYVTGLDLLEEAELIVYEILGELKKRKEYELALRINEVLGKIEAAKREKKLLEARLLGIQRRQILVPEISLALGPTPA